MREWWWIWERRLVDVLMTGTGRCQRRRRKMIGIGADVGSGIEEKPGAVSRVPAAKAPSPVLPSPDFLDSGDSACLGADLYSQALKALSERSPFDSVEVLATTVPTLPIALGSGLLARQSEGRKRHKKSHVEFKSSKKGSTERPKSSSIWVDYEEYFRELTMSDIDMLQNWSTSLELLVSDSCLFMPVRGNVRNQVVSGNDSKSRDYVTCVVKQEIGVNQASMHEDTVLDKEEDQPMDIDNRDGDVLPPAEHESSLPHQLDGLSSLERVLGSRNKILLTTERPTKRRKLLGENAGLQMLVVAKNGMGKLQVCHFCSVGDTGDQLNQLVVCSSCGVRVHQKCYGIQWDVDESWVCSWCKWKNDSEVGEVSSEKGPCMLCPKSGGALKPVQSAGSESCLSTEFAHLFCSLWMPEVYVDDMRMMEPIIDVDRIKEPRKKLICYLCKVKQGTCIRCTDGSCRTSFHPICAREAGHRLEVWRKIGCDDVELRAFCSKHSHGFDEWGKPVTGIGSNSPHSELCELSLLDKPPEDEVGGKRRDQIADCLEVHDVHSNKSTNDKLGRETEDVNPTANCRAEFTTVPNVDDKERSLCEVVDPPDSLDPCLILKKLVDGKKVSLKDLESHIGVPADSLAANLADNHLPPESHCKLIKWLDDRAFTETSQKKPADQISAPSDREGEDGSHPITVKESDMFDVPVKSVPPRRRTISSVRIVKDDNVLSSCKDPNLHNGRITAELRENFQIMEHHDALSKEFVSNGLEKVVAEYVGLQDSSLLISPISERIHADPLKYGDHGSAKMDNEDVSSAFVDMAEGALVHSTTFADCSDCMKMESCSYMHSYIQKKIVEMQSGVFKKSYVDSDGSVELKSSNSKKYSVNGVCSKWDDEEVNHDDEGKGVILDDLLKAKEEGILDLHPEDELEGELIYFQDWLFGHAAKRKCLSDNLICKIVKDLPRELQLVRKQRWDSVLVHQYLHELREAKKQGRKERKYKEAQEILAAATAAAAASSRTSLRKDCIEEGSHQQTPRGRVGPPSLATPRVKETKSCLVMSRNVPDKHLGVMRLSTPVSKEHPCLCDICGRSETILNPILICSSCKVAVHLVCYRNLKESPGPWYCELCESSSADGSIVQVANTSDKPNRIPITECSLCGTVDGAFRKTSSGQWVHALCAEWVLESTFRRGQPNPVGGMESVARRNDVCSVCHQRFGVCIKCNFGPCQSTFHASCARSAGFYMSVRCIGGKQQRRAYCDKHSIEQRSKVEGQKKHGIDELKSLKQVRVELEKLRLICERIVKREKLKRELVLCSHDLLGSKKDTLAFSPLFQNALFTPEASSESATTSHKGQTDCSRSCSTMQKSDDATVDSTVSGKRHIKLLISGDTDQRTDDSSTSQQISTPKLADRASFAGKHMPLRASTTGANIQGAGGKKLKSQKHTETFEKELVMTSDQASMKNQRLPKGYIYVPIDRLSTSTEEQTEHEHGH